MISSAQAELSPAFNPHRAEHPDGAAHHHITPRRICEKCGGVRLALVGPHAPRLEHRGGRWVELDCVGELV